ncbi:MAG TPA: Rieske 2Fe-2S domain-containing protein [Candidatus Kapabacteria bacterium]|nr:Rieske 2Fe-2S domain-containing protein [Candidatus Kapabacteria bacterium]
MLPIVPPEQGSRRAFLKKFGAAVAGITIVGSLPAILESCSSTSVDVGAGSDGGQKLTVDVASLTADNTAIHTKAPVSGREILVVRRSSTTYETLLLVCTHDGCTYPDIDLSGTQIICKCHNSVFDISGGRLSGPAPTALTAFATTFDATAKRVTITF